MLLDRLQTEVAELGVDRKGGELIVAMLQEAREEARDVLLAGLGSPRYMGCSRRSRLRCLRSRHSTRTMSWRRSARRRSRSCGSTPSGSATSRPTRTARAAAIRGKRARYAAELAGLDGDGRIRRFVRPCGSCRTSLGEHQDAVVAEERIRSVSHRFSTATAAGRLIEREHERRRAGARAYPDVLAEALARGRKAFP